MRVIREDLAMTLSRTSWNRIRASRNSGLYLVGAIEIAAACCVAMLCWSGVFVRLSAAWNGLDLIIRNGEIVGLNR